MPNVRTQLANLHAQYGAFPDPSRADGFLRLALLAERVRYFHDAWQSYGREPSWDKDLASDTYHSERADFDACAAKLRAEIRSRQQGFRKDVA